MSETGGTGGLSTAALGGIGATVVVVGGAVLVWLGVFDSGETPSTTRQTDQGQAEITISPSVDQPTVVTGTSLQSEESEAADPQAGTEPAAEPESDDTSEVAVASEPDSSSDAAETAAEVTETQDTPSAEGTPETEVSQQDGSEEATVDAAASTQSEVVNDQPLTVELPAPQLDLVRVDPTGETVIAGRASEGAQVAILLDGDVLELVDVQSGGEFVAFASIPPSSNARVISLRAEAEGQSSLSESSYILAPAAPLPAAQPQEDGEAETSQVAAAAQDADSAPTEAESENGAAADTVAGQQSTGAEAEGAAAQVASVETAATESQSGPDEAGPDETVQATASAVATDAAAESTAEAAEAVSQATTEAALDSAAAAVAIAQQAEDQTAEQVAQQATTQAPEVDAQAEATTPEVAQPASTAVAEQEEVADVQPEPAPQPEATQVAVLRADADGVELVQPAAPAPQGKVVLDTISYSDDGDVQLAGRARTEALVLVYLDNAPAGQFTASQDGTWGGNLTSVEPGVYTLRLDEVDPDGQVLSRLETPFKREAPEVLSPPAQDGEVPAEAPLVRAVTVQEGDTLWAISQKRYGSGFLYVRVFEANQEAIRDPDLIYPGQVFTIPE